MTAQPAAPVGINHLVINVRDIEELHRFWTEVVGLKLVGELRRTPERPNTPQMRFYSGLRGGQLNHHDIALRENKKLPPPPAPGWNDGMPSAIGHVAVAFPSREVWLDRLAYLQERGVKFDRRVEHGMTHSLYIYDPNGYSVELLYELPRDVWEGDIDRALNHYVALPTEGQEALQDKADVPVFKARQPAEI